MSRAPYRLNPSTSLTDNLNLINQNFNQVVEEIDDFGPETGTQTATILLPAGQVTILRMYTDTNSNFSQDAIFFDHKVSFRVDTDHPDYEFPDGVSLSSGQKAIVTGLITSRTPPTGQTSQAIFLWRNADATDHSAHVTARVKVYSKPPPNIFR